MNPSKLGKNSPLEKWLNAQWPDRGTMELGLARITLVAKELGVLRPAPKVFTVAGTNGKGTTCHTLETILIAAGYRVGVYSSPDLLRFTERVRIQGQEPTEDSFSAAFAAVEEVRIAVGVKLTFFEHITLVALYLFLQEGLDVAILEVGLGGRLDAVNVVNADIAVITTINFDHMEHLGNSREAIGREKAGIFRSGSLAVVGAPDLPESVVAVAHQLNSPLFRLGVDWSFTSYPDHWIWQSGTKLLDHLPLPQVPLPNAATALAALHGSGMQVDDEVVKSALGRAKLPGRFQIVRNNPHLILDVAHNPEAAEYLAGKLHTLCSSLDDCGKLRAVVGILADKDIAGVLSPLKDQIDHWYCATLSVPRGANAQVLLSYLSSDIASAFDDIHQAWNQAMEDAAPNDVVIVFGSFHTVGPVLQALLQ